MVAKSRDEMHQEIRDSFAGLPTRIKRTVEWWLETDAMDRSNPLVLIAVTYRDEYRKRLPGPGGRKSPVFVNRELERIQKAFQNLVKCLGTDLSKEAKSALIQSWNGLDWIGWLPMRTLADLEPGAGERYTELLKMAGLPKITVKKRVPPHSFLIRWVSNRLKTGGRPRGHVLPIARCIYMWATGEKDISDEWGETFLDQWWPPRT